MGILALASKLYRRGELAVSNAQFVARIARLAVELERGVATPTQSRTLLGLRGANEAVPAIRQATRVSNDPQTTRTLEGLAKRLDAGGTLTASIGIKLLGAAGGAWTLRPDAGQTHLETSLNAPAVTLESETNDFLAVLEGRKNAFTAAVEGKLRVEGDRTVLMQLADRLAR